MPPPSITPARPTIAVRGQDSNVLTAALVGLAVFENTDGLCRCEATFSNWGTVAGQPGFPFFDRSLLDFGVSFQIRLAPSQRPLFDGRIVALEGGFPASGPPTITVRAEDRLGDLRTTQRTRTFEQVSDADVARAMAGDHGLTAIVDLSGPTHQLLAQLNQSDLSFLQERARAADADIWVDDTTLHLQARAHRTGSAVVLALGSSLREFSVAADLTHQRTSVVVGGWDVRGKEKIERVATDAVLVDELRDRVSGPSVLATAFGAREETVAGISLSGDEARAEAASRFTAMARAFVVGRGIADPDTQLRAGAQADLVGLGPLFSGRYDVTECVWVFDTDGGLRVEFIAQSPGLGRS